MDLSDSAKYKRTSAAMKAASEGNEKAHSFLFQLYHRDQMPPELKRLMEELIDDVVKVVNYIKVAVPSGLAE